MNQNPISHEAVGLRPSLPKRTTNPFGLGTGPKQQRKRLSFTLNMTSLVTKAVSVTARKCVSCRGVNIMMMWEEEAAAFTTDTTT